MKYVREHINEKFTDESDPIKDIGIGIVEKYENIIQNLFNYPNFKVYVKHIIIKDDGSLFCIKFIDVLNSVYEAKGIMNSAVHNSILKNCLKFPATSKNSVFVSMIKPYNYYIYKINTEYQNLFKELKKVYKKFNI